MPEPDSPAPSPPASQPSGASPLPVRVARRQARQLVRIARRVAVWLDLRFGRREPLRPVATEVSLPPLFVGGTGRSGTTVSARILGAHPAYRMIPVEIKFLSARGGLCDLADGHTEFHKFARQMLDDRWLITGPRVGKRNLTSEARVRAALVELRDGLKADRHRAAARFVHRLLDPVAIDAGASGWIEMTPSNVRVAPTLARCWPDAKLVHAVRDGRDVACSVAPLTWGPDTFEESLRWWGRSLDQAFATCAQAPEGFVRTVRMESLLDTDRELELARLLAFAGLDETPEVRTFFDERAPASRANIGRWRKDVPAAEVPGFLALHDELAGRLAAKDYPYVPNEEPAEPLVAAEASTFAHEGRTG